jgi:ABC-type Na+ efflux pump permease subunit
VETLIPIIAVVVLVVGVFGGARWLNRASGGLSRELLVTAVVVLALAAAAWFYLAVYDTADGKCHRGDASACLMVGR